MKRLLSSYRYEEAKTDKTSGSRVAFINPETRHIIRLHKPHPHPELKQYQIDDVLEELKRQGISLNHFIKKAIEREMGDKIDKLKL